MPGTGLRTGCSTCCPGPGGTPTGSASTCAVTSWNIWVIQARCWWWMRRGTSRKAAPRRGVQRQYTGTAGRIENAQVAVYLGYAAPRGHALIDRELYVPKSWTADAARCAAAGIPDGIGFAAKPALGRRMLA